MDLDDQLRSVNRMLWQLFADRIALPEGFRIELQRVRLIVRPMMRLERTNHREVDFGEGAWRDDCQFAITYYGDDRQDVDKVTNKIRQYIDNGGTDYSNLNLIQGWRFGWAFPPPLDLAPKTDIVGTIPAGTYQIRISGIDICGNESAASPQLPVTLLGPGTIYLRVPRVPWNHPLFPSYNCYVNGHLEATISMPQWGYPEFVLSQITGTGVAPKETVDPSGALTAIRWRHLRVTRFSSVAREDQIENGKWQSTITLETSVMQPRNKPQTDVIGYVQVTETVASIEGSFTTGMGTVTIEAGTP